MTGLLLSVLKELLRRLILRWDHIPPISVLKERHETYLAAQLEGQVGLERAGDERNCGVYARSVRNLPYRRVIELKLSLWLWGGLIK